MTTWTVAVLLAGLGSDMGCYSSIAVYICTYIMCIDLVFPNAPHKTRTDLQVFKWQPEYELLITCC